MKKTLLALTFALSFCAAAQVNLIGNPSDPAIVNHAGKTIVAAMAEIKYADRRTVIHRRLFTGDGDELTDGRTLPFGVAKHHLRGAVPVSAKLLAVIFSDGELRGEDTHEFQVDMEKAFASMRQSAAMAEAGDWVGLRAKAESKNGKNGDDDSFGISAAAHLIAVHDKGHNVQSPGHFGSLPTHIWNVGTPLAITLHMPSILAGVFDAFKTWISPIAAHAQTTFCCTAAWNNTSYDCVTYNFPNVSPYPCPAPGQNTTWTGMTASCLSSATVGVSNISSIDDSGYPAVHQTAFANSQNTRLTTAGYCRDIVACNYETWSFHIDCNNVITTDYDTTNGTCGTNPQMYPSPLV